MQSISRFLAVLIALIFLIGPLAGSAAAHETEDGDHADTEFGSLVLIRQDTLTNTVYVGQMLQFAVDFTDSVDHPVPTATSIVFMVGGVTRQLTPPHRWSWRDF